MLHVCVRVSVFAAMIVTVRMRRRAVSDWRRTSRCSVCQTCQRVHNVFFRHKANAGRFVAINLVANLYVAYAIRH